MYKDKRGLWREAITIDGKRKVFSAKSKKDLALKLMTFNIKQKDTTTFSAVADLWEEENWEKLKYGSHRTYAPCLRRCREKFGNKQICDIRPKDVALWLRELGEDLAFKTVKNHKSVLSQIIDYAIVNLDMDISNPCDRVKMPSGLRKGTRKALTEDERKTIKETTKDDFQLAFLILYTGCRCGEALALQMRDVDMENNIIHIHSSVTHHGNTPEITPPKTANSVRIVPLLPPLKSRLKQLKLKQTDYIVSGERPLTKSALAKRWKKYCKEHDLSIDRHTIRHQYATTLFEAGIDVKTAQDLLGHAQISTTMDIYTHLTDEKRLKEYIQLATFIETQA